MGNRLAERMRIALSRVLMVGVGLLLVLSRSAWEGHIVDVALFFCGCLLVGVGTIGRVWATLYITGRKTSALVTTGPYSLCRNPLYLFSLVGGLGVALATETLTIPLLYVLPFALYYPRVIRSEERRLRTAHGDLFDAYCRTTPAFWPRMSGLREDAIYQVNAISFRKHITDALWFVWLVGGIELVESLHEFGLVRARLTLY